MKRNRGFTLIEVVVTLSLLAIALLGFHQGQANSIKVSRRAEFKLQAANLAQMKMTEIELDLKQKGFRAFTDEETGEFADEKFKNKFKWTRKFERVDIGCFLPEPSSDGSDKQSPQNTGLFSTVKTFFENAIRKIKISVEWEEAGKKYKVQISQLYVRFEDLPQGP